MGDVGKHKFNQIAFPLIKDKIKNVKQDLRIIMTHEKKNMMQKCDGKDKTAFAYLQRSSLLKGGDS